MRTLLLLRHAKSSWDRPELADVDRPLAKRGQQAAPLVAKYLSKHCMVPELVLCSHAARVRETWRLMEPILDRSVACRTLRTLYLGTPARLLEALRRTDDAVHRLMLIGHNPGLGALAVKLCGSGPDKPLARLHAKFPTAALAVIDFDAERWSEVAPGAGRLEAFVRPKDIR